MATVAHNIHILSEVPNAIRECDFCRSQSIGVYTVQTLLQGKKGFSLRRKYFSHLFILLRPASTYAQNTVLCCRVSDLYSLQLRDRHSAETELHSSQVKTRSMLSSTFTPYSQAEPMD